MARGEIKLDEYGRVADPGYIDLFETKNIKYWVARSGLQARGGQIVASMGERVLGKKVGEGYCAEKIKIGEGAWAVFRTEWRREGRVLISSDPLFTWLVVQKDGVVQKFEYNELSEAALYLGLDFSAEIAFQKIQNRIIEERKRRAEKILAAINAEQVEYAGQEMDGILVVPEFLKAPGLGEIIDLIEEGKMADEDGFILRFGTPSHWQVESPVFVKGSTAEEAVQRALKIQEERAAAAEAAMAEAEKSGLPSLKGTERQVAWALKIRKEYADKYPNSSTLKRATTAKFWIENRLSLPAA